LQLAEQSSPSLIKVVHHLPSSAKSLRPNVTLHGCAT
jgi:hypothetical protein